MEFARRQRRLRRREEALALILVRQDTAEVVGGVGLHNIRAPHGRAELGYWVAVPHWREGYALEATRAVMDVAFGRLGMHRLEAAVFEGNGPSAALLRKLGFRREGVMREKFWHWGGWRNEIRFGITVGEYRARKRGSSVRARRG